MNALEIKKRQHQLSALMTIEATDDAAVGVCFWLSEIALQSAEANEPLVINENAKPGWVWFDSGDGTKICVDASKVSLIQEFSKYVVLGDPFDRKASVVVYESLSDVCAKLGIPMEGK